jgi:hypothetical protein
MKKNAKSALKPPLDLNHVIRLLQNLRSSQVLVLELLEYFKVAEIVTTQVIGSMKDERCFQH